MRCYRRVVGEAMEYAANPCGEGLELGQCVFEGVALMDNAIQAEFGGDFEVLLEQVGLFLFVVVVGG